MNLRSDFHNHMSAMLTNKITCELANHFNKEEHHSSDFEFNVIEQICNAVTNDTVNRGCFPKRLFGARPQIKIGVQLQEKN